jgi:hypothetical protein
MLNQNFNFQTRFSEQDLYENLIIESVQTYGMDIQYCPKTLVNFDALLGEDNQRAFLKSITIEAYQENLDGFFGDKNFLNKLGLNIDKEASFIIAKRRFDEVVLGLNWRDFWKETNTYSVNDAVHYQGKVYTNISAVHNLQFTLSGVSGIFTQFDPIIGLTSGATGLVSSFDPLTNILILTDVVGTFVVSETINDTFGSFPSPESIITDSSINFIFPGTGIINTITTGTNISPLSDTTHWKVMQQVRPMEGDLIYLPITGDIFEILFADHEEVFYQLGKIYVWKITAEKFRYSHETLDTGIDAIDEIATQLENDDSLINDPLADNDNISDSVEAFLNLDNNRPF